jgi:hypothetical protein
VLTTKAIPASHCRAAETASSPAHTWDGLNLRRFATAVFYEIEWSLPILWQALRRVYRPGAPLPVRVLFPTSSTT